MTTRRPCKVCSHAKRAALERAVLAGKESLTRIGAVYGVSRFALARHRDGHMPQVSLVAQPVDTSSLTSAQDEMEMLLERLKRRVEWVESSGSPRDWASFTREFRETLMAWARLTREYVASPRSVNLLIDPGFMRALQVIREEAPPQVFEKIRDRIVLEAERDAS